MPELSSPPENREPDLHALTSTFLTPQKVAYRRNHSPYPTNLSASTFTIALSGPLISHPKPLTIPSLASLPQHTITAALQCAGNRRNTMRTSLAEVQGLNWFDGAVFNASWRGPRLRDVLLASGLTIPEREWQKAHVAFACHAVPCQDADWYGASIPLCRAMDPEAEVVLAMEMNGEPLTPEHGYPVRVVVPGAAGARAVKWLDEISVQWEMSSNHYMHFDYKVLPPEAVDSESAKKFWGVTPPVIEMPVNSVVAVPAPGSKVQTDGEGKVVCKGYAVPSGDDGPVTKVEVSGDGENWVEAELLEGEGDSKWSWKLWEAKIEMQRGEGRAVFSRATDQTGQTQPRHSQWNLRGVCYHGYGEASGLSVQ